MSWFPAEFLPAVPEMFVLAMICVILIVDLFLSEERRDISFTLALVTLAGAAWLTSRVVPAGPELIFNGTFITDPLSHVLKLVSYGAVALVFLFSRDYLKQCEIFKGEYFVLGLFALLGIMVMISAHSFLTMYLGLELLSLSLYTLVAFDRDSPVASEAAMKYFVLGAIASGTLLYGISMLYGLTGTVDFDELAIILTLETAGVPHLFALAFILVGIAFKFGAVPFHMWLPDVYHGAPTSVTLFVGSAPKLAALAMILRILTEAMAPASDGWQDMLMVVAVLSVALGNIVAIAQENIKRMLAYSTISHMGFILLGVMTGTKAGYGAAMFYTIAYVLMTIVSFGMIILLSRRGFESDRLEDFKGLNARSPWFAAMMLIVMLSLAGVPPFIGFVAKLSIFYALVDANQTWLAAMAVIFTVIGLFYYLRVIKLMYFDEAQDPSGITARLDTRVFLSATALAILVLGVFPGGLLDLCAGVF